MKWFRWWHGTASDPKFGSIARKTGQTRERAVFVWMMVLESASEGGDRGQITTDADAIADTLNCDTADVQAILADMEARGMIAEHRVAKWDERQPARDDSTTRQRKRRARDTDVTRAPRDSDAQTTRPDTESDTEGNSNELPMRKSGSYSEEFETYFWKPYPSQGMSKAQAYDEWKKLAPDDRKAAITALPAFMRHEDDRLRRSPDSGRLHACRYLKQRRWEGFEAAPPPELSGVSIYPNTPQARAWKAHYAPLKATDRNASVKWSMLNQDRVIREETEYPPDYTHTEAAE